MTGLQRLLRLEKPLTFQIEQNLPDQSEDNVCTKDEGACGPFVYFVTRYVIQWKILGALKDGSVLDLKMTQEDKTSMVFDSYKIRQYVRARIEAAKLAQRDTDAISKAKKEEVANSEDQVSIEGSIVGEGVNCPNDDDPREESSNGTQNANSEDQHPVEGSIVGEGGNCPDNDDASEESSNGTQNDDCEWR